MDIVNDCDCGNIHIDIVDIQFPGTVSMSVSVGDERVSFRIITSSGSEICFISRADLDRMLAAIPRRDA